jgi:hypothetical protein
MRSSLGDFKDFYLLNEELEKEKNNRILFTEVVSMISQDFKRLPFTYGTPAQ